MPTYQYTCTDCGEPLEVVQAFTDDPLTECPSCGGRLRKVFSSVGVVFKGSGFYRTDSRGSESKGGTDKGSADKGSADKGSADKGSADKGSADKAAAPKPAAAKGKDGGSGGSGGTGSSGGSGGKAVTTAS